MSISFWWIPGMQNFDISDISGLIGWKFDISSDFDRE